MHSLSTGILLALLLVAAWRDFCHYRIPNKLVFPGAALGILLHALLPQDMGGLGLLTSLAGLSVGLAVLLPLYLLRAMGAGDIKLMAMTGAFVGPTSILIITVYVLLAGGILALGVILLRGKLLRLVDNLKIMLLMLVAGSSTANLPTTETLHKSAVRLPYGVAIAAGTLLYLVTEYRIFG